MALVGRERELALLRGVLADARGGPGRLVLCSGEAGVGKTRLAQELAGIALATGTAVAWGRCVEAEGAPAFWPWRGVLRTVGVDPEQGLVDEVVPEGGRFGYVERVAGELLGAATGDGLLIVLDDVHWADELSLMLLSHLADRIHETSVALVATYRDGASGGGLARALPDLYRAPGVERVHLERFGLAEVRAQLASVGADDDRAREVLEVTGGNPLFVRETARAIVEGSWRPDRPPRTVVDVVGARVGRLGEADRRFVQAAAVVGRQLTLPLLALVLGVPVAECIAALDRVVAVGLVDQLGDTGEVRFTHALSRDAVESTLSTADRIALHQAAATALATWWADTLDDHAAEVAGHWLALAAFGHAEQARAWATRAAEVAVRGLAYEEGIRLYRCALEVDAPWPDPAVRCRVQLGLAAAARLAGLHEKALAAARATAAAAAALSRVDLLCEAALVVEPAADPMLNVVLAELCAQALDALDASVGLGGLDVSGAGASTGPRARLVARSSRLAFYAGDQDRAAAASLVALDLARAGGDDLALVEALRARHDACPGRSGREERLGLAAEMVGVAGRVASAQAAMWGCMWRVDALVEGGDLPAAADEMVPLARAVAGVGGAVNAWHLDRVGAALAQAQGRADDAVVAARRGFDRMCRLEPAAATGAYLGVHSALSRHFRVPADALAFARGPLHPPPGFVAMAQVARACLLLAAGHVEEASAHYQQARQAGPSGPAGSWSWPSFFTASGYALVAQVAIGLDLPDDLAAAVTALEPFRGEHIVGSGVHYLGPVELTLGWAALARGRLDQAVEDLSHAADRADTCGAPGFAAEARHHLAAALLARSDPGDRKPAWHAARDSHRQIQLLRMTALSERSVVLLRHTRPGQSPALSARELEVAHLVADGLSNRQVAARLVISERTAGNHVQHILTKLGFSSRSQIIAWYLRAGE